MVNQDDSRLKCSFCGKSQDQVKKLIAGPDVYICDEGIGIPKSDLSRITKAFFTGENGRKTGESTGMGLYIAKELCDKLGHQLIITSEVGQGTQIEVVFQS